MKRSRYADAPKNVAKAIEESEIIDDFLPSPRDLVYKEDNVKVTLELSRKSITRFKRFAKRRGLPYQRMIRSLVDQYAEKALPDK